MAYIDPQLEKYPTNIKITIVPEKPYDIGEFKGFFTAFFEEVEQWLSMKGKKT